MLEFKDCPVVDNHAHILNPKRQTIEPIWLAREFFHGMADTPIRGVAKSEALGRHGRAPAPFSPYGGRPDGGLPACQAVRLRADARGGHRRAEPPDGDGWDSPATRRCSTRMPGIVCSVMDSGPSPQRSDPRSDPRPETSAAPDGSASPETPEDRAAPTPSSSSSFQAGVESAIRQDGFVGIKSHLGELIGLGHAAGGGG